MTATGGSSLLMDKFKIEFVPPRGQLAPQLVDAVVNDHW